jgi:MFS family permease
VTAAPPSAPAPEDRAGVGAWWTLTVLFVLYLVSFLDRNIMAMLVGPIKADLHLSDTQMSLLLGPAFAISYAVFGLPMGWLADRLSRRWVIFLGSCVFGLATAFSGLASGFVALFLARIMVGAGEASLSPAAYSLLTDRFPRRLLMRALSIYSMGIKTGAASALVLGGLMIAAIGSTRVNLPFVGDLQPWHLVLMSTGVPAIVLGLFVFTFREPARAPRPPKGSTDGELLAFLRAEWRLVVPMYGGFAIMGTFGYSLTAWIPTFMGRQFGWEAARFGPMLGAISLAAALTLPFTAWIVDRMFTRGIKDAHIRFYLWLLIASIPVIAFMFFLRSAVLFLGIWALVQVMAIPIMGYISTAIQLVSPTRLRGQMTALFLFLLTVVGGSVGPVIVAVMTDSVFHDPAKLGQALAIIGMITTPATAVLLALSLKPMREAIARRDARGD